MPVPPPQSKRDPLCRPLTVWLLALVCCALWGSAFPCIKFGYEMLQISQSDTAAQILFAGCRFTLAGLLVIAFGSIGKKSLLCPRSAHTWGNVCKLSLLQTVLQYAFFYIGLANTTATKASVLTASNVFLAVLIACLLFRQEKISVGKVLACLLGFSGVVLINATGVSAGFSLTGEGFILLSAACYAFSSVLIRQYSQSENPVLLSGWQFALGGAVMIAGGLLCGGRIGHFSPGGALMLVYLAALSAVAYTLWGVLLQHNPVSRITVFGFMNPVCGVLLSALLRNEGDLFDIRFLFALILVCAGIILANMKDRGK